MPRIGTAIELQGAPDLLAQVPERMNQLAGQEFLQINGPRYVGLPG